MTTMEQLVISLIDYTNNKSKISVSKKDYDIFCKEYIFTQLKDIPFGVAFAEHFGIENDYLLRVLKDENFIKDHISNMGYISER